MTKRVADKLSVTVVACGNPQGSASNTVQIKTVTPLSGPISAHSRTCVCVCVCVLTKGSQLQHKTSVAEISNDCFLKLVTAIETLINQIHSVWINVKHRFETLHVRHYCCEIAHH